MSTGRARRAENYDAAAKSQIVQEVLQGERTPEEIAKAHHVSRVTLWRWKKAYARQGEAALAAKRPGRPKGPRAVPGISEEAKALPKGAQARIAELERLCRRLSLENELFKKSCRQRTIGHRHALIEQAQAGSLPLSVRQLGRLLKVNRGWWYAQRVQRAKREAKQRQEATLCQRIAQLREQFAGYGYRRVTAALRRAGEKINGKRALRLLRELGWLCHPHKLHQHTTRPGDQSLVALNLLRDRQVSRPNEIWVSDLTSIRLPGRFVYLATVLDVFTRVCVGWHLSASLETSAVLEAVQQAIDTRHPPTGLILHSDRGCQYTSHAYQDLARSIQTQVSMARKGKPSDNAYAGSLFGTLKREEVRRHTYQSLQDAQEQLARFFQQYNTQRLHSSLGYLPSLEFEQDVLAATASTSQDFLVCTTGGRSADIYQAFLQFRHGLGTACFSYCLVKRVVFSSWLSATSAMAIRHRGEMATIICLFCLHCLSEPLYLLSISP